MKFIQYFENSIKDNWEQKALSNYESKQDYYYKDVAREIARIHLLFKELNLSQDDKIALIGENSPEWALVFLATITYGAVIVPILKDFSSDNIHHIVNHSETSLVFVTESTWDKLDVSQMADVRAFFSLSDFRCLSQRQGESIHITMRTLPRLFRETFPNGVQPQDICYTKKDDNEMIMLNYTSGTSGYSKGVMLTGDNFCCQMEFAKAYGYGVCGDRVVSLLPMSHVYGCVADLFFCFRVGMNITFLTQTTSAKLLKSFEDVKPSYISIVPFFIELVIKQIQTLCASTSFKILSRLPIVSMFVYRKVRNELVKIFGGQFSRLFIAGAPLNREVEDFLRRIKFPYISAYGMTECASLITINSPSYVPYSVGKPIPGVQVKIESGEILVKGRIVMKGYYKDEESTRKCFTKDGWLKTGDLGKLDKNGHIFITGRLKNMILTASGQNVYPEEIESKLNSMPMISESVVIQKGDKIVALVYPDFSVVDKGMDLEAMRTLMDAQRREVNRLLADYEHISEFEIRYTEFEKTPKKSIKRYLYEN